MSFKKNATNRTKPLKALFLACLIFINCACANAAEENSYNSEEKMRWHAELYQALENAETDDEKIIQMTPEELKAIDFTDCDIAAIDGLKIYEWLSEEKTKEFAEMIANADINTEESDIEYPSRNGEIPHELFQITLSSGDVLFIGETPILEREEGYNANGDNYYFVINGNHLYQCDEETTNKIRDYWDEAHARFEDYVKDSFVQEQKGGFK